VHGMNQAGWLLERGAGVPADRARALAYYRQAAEKKSDWATDRLARLLITPRSGQAEKEEGWKWIKHGALRGQDSMRLRAAAMVLSGFRDDDEVAAVAQAWLEQAAAKSQPGARTELGRCLLHGWGMPQDLVRANTMFAAEQSGDELARMLWARNLAFGVGTPRDLARAETLFESLQDKTLRTQLEKYLVVAEEAVEPGEVPVALHRDAPNYPLRLRRNGVAGNVRVSFQINAEGFTEQISVRAATRPEFGYEAKLAVAFWRFHPAATHGGEAFEQVMEFRVDEDE
jgi:TonB family protein